MATSIHILIVEDRPEDADLVAKHVRQAGYEVDWQRVNSKADFLALLDISIDVILADYSVPGFGGEKALDLLKQSGLDIPFIVVSGMLGDEKAAGLIKRGATDYIVKSNLGRLPEAVRRALAEKQLRMEKQQAEQALRESQERFQQLAENIDEVFFLVDILSNEILYISPAHDRIWGQSRERIHILDDLVVDIHPDDRQAFLSVPRQAGPQPPIEYRVIRPDKTTRRILSQSYPVLGPEGQVIRLAGVAKDVTEQRLAEAAERASHARLTAFASALPDLAFVLDEDGTYVEILTRQHELLVEDVDNMLGRRIHDLLPRQQSDLIMAAVHETVRTTATQVVEYSLEVQAGHRWFEGRTALMDSASGSNTRVVMLVRDITERKQAEQALQKRAVQLRLVNEISKQIAAVLDLTTLFDTAVKLIHEHFDYQHVGLFTVDRERGEVVMKSRAGMYASKFPVNPRLKLGTGMVGWVAEHGDLLLANDVTAESRFSNPFPEQIIRAEVSIPIRVGEEVVGVLDVQSNERDVFHDSDLLVLETLTGQIAVAMQNASFYHELETYSDFLQQAVKDRTADIEHIKNRLESILNNCPDPIILLNRYGAVETANPAFYILFHTDIDGIRKLSLPELVISGHTETVRNALHEVMVNRKMQRLEVTALCADETTFEADIALAIIRQDSQIMGMVCILRDITALKEVDRLKDEFVSNVSHELRTPIASMRLNQDLIVRNPAKQSVYLERLKRETDRLNGLIEDLLRLSRLDQGRVEMHLELIDLNNLVTQYVNDRIPLAESKQLTLTSKLKSGKALVKADMGLLGQVLSILLTNAVNYTLASGQIVIRTHVRKNRTGQWVGFSVKDTGPGIAIDEQSKLFERFFRGRAGKTSGVTGTGLGLAIAKEIIDMHKGTIEMVSEGISGKGSTFTVWLPT